MKILITGTYSSGKTTICKKILEACLAQGWNTICPTETARTMNLPMNFKQNGETSALLIGAQISMEKHLIRTCEILICDRGLPDIWSHNLAQNNKSLSIQSPEIEPLAREWSKSYDFVIQSTSDEKIKIPHDGIRVTDTSYRADLEVFHRRSMSTLGIIPNVCFGSSDLSVKSAVSETLDYLRQRTASRAS